LWFVLIWLFAMTSLPIARCTVNGTGLPYAI
jgi:hypothetical protein